MKKELKRAAPQGNRKNIPQEAHRRASMVAKALMKLPPKPTKQLVKVARFFVDREPYPSVHRLVTPTPIEVFCRPYQQLDSVFGRLYLDSSGYGVRRPPLRSGAGAWRIRYS